MIKAVQIIFTPFSAWEKISLAERGILWILLFALIPWVAIGAGAETYGLIKWGDRKGGIEQSIKVPEEVAIRYGVSQAVLLVAGALVAAQVLSLIVTSFGVRTTYAACFRLIGYAFVPLALARILDAVPVVSTWICFGVGMAFSFATLYHGVGLVLKPEQTKGFSLFILSGVVVGAIGGIVHILALAVLNGRILA